MKNNTNTETKCEEPHSITVAIKEPMSGEDRLITLKIDGSLAKKIEELIDAGFAGALCDALEVEADKPEAKLFVWELLIRLEIHEARYEEAAARGRYLRERKLLRPDSSMRLIVALAHQYAGRLGEAYAIMAENYRPSYDYQMACCAARMGWHSVAIGHLIKAAAISDANHSRCMFDEDLVPLWEYFISGEANFRDCVLIISPEIAPCFKLETSESNEWGFLDHFDFAKVPERLRPAIRSIFFHVVYVPRQPGDRGYDPKLGNALHHFRSHGILERIGRAKHVQGIARFILNLFAKAEMEAEAGNMESACEHLRVIISYFPNAAMDLKVFCQNKKLRLLASELSTGGQSRLRRASEDFSKN